MGLAILSSALITTTDAWAQVTYVVNQFTQPLVPLAGGTPVQVQFDSVINEPIGFTFELYGQPYDFVAIGENGAIALEHSCNLGCDFRNEFCDFNTNACMPFWFPPDFDGVGSPNIPNQVLAAWWDDLMFEPFAAPVSTIRFATVGTAPNREFVVEYRNMRHNSFQPASRAIFQIRLVEGSNLVRFHYGTFTSGADSNEWSGIIGIEDQFGQNPVYGLPCAQSVFPGCPASTLSSLANQVIEIGVPNVPELTGSVRGPLGGQAGQNAQFFVTARNVGRQPTPVGFSAQVYLSTDTTIIPGLDSLVGTVTFPVVAALSSVTATLTAPVPNLAQAYYNVGAFIDSGGVIAEATEANNIVLSGTPFLLGTDLEVSFEEPPPSMTPGAPALVPFTILNRSSALSNVRWDVSLSVDSIWDAGDVQIAQGTTNLAAGSAVPIVANANVPPVAPGFYFVIARVDPTGLIAEADEFNNEIAANSLVGPELSITGVTAPATSGVGASIPLTLFIDNPGSPVNGVQIEVYLSRDSVLDANDALVLTTTAAISGGESQALPRTGQVPAGLTSSSYFIIALIDPANLVPEVEEFNNTYISFQPDVRLIGPDLIADSVGGDSLAFRGLPYRVQASVRNGGGTPLANFYCSIHFSVNALITTNDPMLVEVGPFSLQPGEVRSFEAVGTISATMTPGLYYLGIIADSRSALIDDRPINNIRRAFEQVTVRDIAPNFFVSELTIPSQAGAGESFPVQRVMENQGNDQGTVSYQIYLSDTDAVTRYALIGQGTATLSVGEIDIGVDTVMVPPDIAAGRYKVEYVLDPDELVDELKESDNETKSVDVVDIVAAQLSIATTALPLATVGLRYEFDLVAQGATGPLTWSVPAGSLPMGLSLDPASGRISGVPAHAEHPRFTIHVTDGTFARERPLDLLVADPTIDLKVVSRAVPPIWVGQPYEFPLTAIGGIPPYSWRVNQALPAGLTLTSSGTIAGVTSTVAPSHVYTFTVSDAVNDTATGQISLRVLARDDSLRFGTEGLPDGVVNVDYESTLSAVQGVPPYVFELASGELPAGLAVEKVGSAGEYKIVGTPTTPGEYVFELRVTDDAGDFDVNAYVVVITAGDGVRWVTTSLPSGTTGVEYLDADQRPVVLKAVDGSGSGTPVTFALATGTLPAGMELMPAGRIQGTPTAAGIYSFSVRASAEGRQDQLRAFGIAIAEPVPTPINPEETGGCGCSSTETRTGASWLLALAAVVVLARRRLRGLAALLALVVVLGLPGLASAQRGDGGVGPGGGDAGTSGGPSLYFQETLTNQTYTSRTMGTVLQTSFGSIDDDYATVTLPFAFHYFDQDYTTAYISTNGIVTFDSSYPSSLSGQLFPDPNQPNAVIAAIWNDMLSPNMSMTVEGSEPNRVVIFQWESSTHYSGSGESISWQIWLNEGRAGRFEIHYGPTSGTGGFYNGAVGFEDMPGGIGFNFPACTPSCTWTDFSGFSSTGTVFAAFQDAGDDVFALGVAPVDQSEPLHIYQNIPFDVETRLGAFHEAPVGPFVYSIHLLGVNESAPSTPAIFTSTATTLGIFEVRTIVNAINIPLTTAPGRYKLALVADSADQVMEPNELNNLYVSERLFVVGDRRPDFTISDITTPAQNASPGDTIQVTVGLSNAGNLDGSADWKLVISANITPSPNDLVLYSAPGAVNLPGGTVQATSVDVQLPATLPAGVYYLGALIDPGNSVSELNEVNNVGRAMTPISVGETTVAVATTSLPIGYARVSYSATLRATGGDGSYTWSLSSGQLPAGLTLIPGTGEIRGLPTAAGQSTLTVEVASAGQTASRSLTLDIQAQGGPLTIVTHNLLPGVVGQAYPIGAEQRIVAVGGTATVSFTLMNDAPPGMSMDARGKVQGVPASAGDYMLSVSATDGTMTAMRDIPLTVVEPGRLALIAESLPDATVGDIYSFQLSAVGAAPMTSVRFALADGSGPLPDGLSIIESGEISGTPSRAGTFRFVVLAAESDGTPPARDTANFTLTVNAPATLAVTPSDLPNATVGAAYEVVLSARNGVGPFDWVVETTGELPRGLGVEVKEIEAEKKVRIFGTPEVVPEPAGLVSLLVRVTDSQGRHLDQPVSFRVLPAAIVTVPTTEEGGCGCNSAGDRSQGVATLFGLVLGGMLLRRRARR